MTRRVLGRQTPVSPLTTADESIIGQGKKMHSRHLPALRPLSLLLTAIYLSTASHAQSSTSPPNLPAQTPHPTCSNWQPSQDPTIKLTCLRTSAKCFALPYGTLGFFSHLLTYYCLIVNLRGRRPLMPWRAQEHGRFNLVVGGVQLVGTTVVAVLAARRCRDSFDLEMLALWLVMTSVASALAGVFGRGRWLFTRRPWEKGRAENQFDLQQQPSDQGAVDSPPLDDGVLDRRARYGQWLAWGLVGSCWLTGGILGLLAAFNTLILTWSSVPPARKVTFAFAGCLVLAIGVAVHASRSPDGTSYATKRGRVATFLFVLFLYALFYIDWLVAAVMENWSGLPGRLDRGGQALYWTYFAFKRLALLVN